MAEEAKKTRLIHQCQFLKEAGNSSVKGGKFQQAEQKYSEALQLYSKDATIFCNRALCYLRLNRAEDAKMDCDVALRLDSTYVKAYFRRAQARKALNRLREAKLDLEHVLKLEPKNKEAERQLEELRATNVPTPLKSVSKAEPERSTNQLRKIAIRDVIEDVDMRDIAAEQPMEQEVEEDMVEQSMPPVASCTFQLLNDIRLLRTSPALLDHYIRGVKPSDYLELIGDWLDEELLSYWLRALLSDEQEDGKALCLEKVRLLTSLPRFSTAVMLVDERLKQDVQGWLTHVKRETAYSDEELADLASRFV